jgi:hypothetical protein
MAKGLAESIPNSAGTNLFTPAAMAASIKAFWFPISDVARQDTTISIPDRAGVGEVVEVKPTRWMVRLGWGWSFEELPPIREITVRCNLWKKGRRGLGGQGFLLRL